MTRPDPLEELARLIGETDPYSSLGRLIDRDQRKPYSIHDRHRDARKLRRARRINVVMLTLLFMLSGWFVVDLIWHGIKGAYYRAGDLRRWLDFNWTL